MVAARISSRLLPVQPWCSHGRLGNDPYMAAAFPHFPPLWRESRAGVEAAALFRSSVWRGGGVPDGEGRPVLLIPGFMAGEGPVAAVEGRVRGDGDPPPPAGDPAEWGWSAGKLTRGGAPRGRGPP